MVEETGKSRDDNNEKSSGKQFMRDSVKEFMSESVRQSDKRSHLLAKHKECLMILS